MRIPLQIHAHSQTDKCALTHARTHTNRIKWDTPSLRDLFLSVPSYSLVLSFHRRQAGRGKHRRKRELETRDEGEKRMCLFRRSADMKQVSPVNFSAAIRSSAFLSIPLFLRFFFFFTSAPSVPPIWVILSSVSLLVCSRYRTRQREVKVKEREKKRGSDKMSMEESSAPIILHGSHSNNSLTNSTSQDNYISVSLCSACQPEKQSSRLWHAQR